MVLDSADQLLGVGSVMAGELQPEKVLARDGRRVTTVEARRLGTCAACRPSGPRPLCMGVFDGVHRGHEALLEATVAVAAERDLPPPP